MRNGKSQSVTLFINTAVREEQYLEINGQRFVSNDDILVTLSEALASLNLDVTDITEIKTNLGPGSFTGLRRGISVSNTLKYLLNLVPINELDVPEYGQEPSINKRS